MTRPDALKDKVVIVTGVTSGLGHGLARGFAAQGASVVGVGRREAEGEALAEQIDVAGGTCLFVRADVSIDTDCDHIVNACMRQFGRVDVLINNAAVVGERTPASLSTTAVMKPGPITEKKTAMWYFSFLNTKRSSAP